MNRLSLAQVTLCAVDTRAPALAAQSLLRSMSQVDFGRACLFTEGWRPAVALPGIELIDIGPIRSGADYSRFVLRDLPGHIHSSHVLITQWDGFVVNAAAWTDEFLGYDYLGAVWPDQGAASNVGNGGFSLRSRRFLAAGLDARIVELHPEDQVMCRDQRGFLERVHGVRFAPAPLARRFAHENETPRGVPFGFHGPKNLPAALDEPTMTDWLGQLPPDFFRSRDARRLARSLLWHRMPHAARLLLQRRQAAGRTDANTRMLGAAAALMALLS